MQLNEQLTTFTAPLTKAGVHTRFDKELESEDIHISVTLKNQKHRDQVVKLVQEINYSDLKNILDGKNINV